MIRRAANGSAPWLLRGWGIAIGAAAAGGAVLYLIRDRLAADFWPVDSSRIAPNLVASLIQWIVVLIVASLLYPAVRAFFRSEFDRLHDRIDANHKQHLEAIARLSNDDSGSS